MLGFRYLKLPPTTYVMQYRHGKITREGAGLSFLYFAPTSVLVQISQSSVGVPFVFNEVTSDFQDATIQGELTYRIKDPNRLATLLDYSVDGKGQYQSDDPDKLGERLIRTSQIQARAYTQQRTIRELMTSSDELVNAMLDSLQKSEEVANVGVEILGLSVGSIKGTPELTKAMQAEAREALLRRADEAIAARRNAAVEQERVIKENELQTEIKVEQQRSTLVDQRVANEEKEARARAVALKAVLEPIHDIDWHKLMAVSGGASNPKSMVAMAFRDLADNAQKIASLNISPDLLSTLLQNDDE